MRALLVVNPKATATSPRGRDVLIRALGSDLKLDVAETTHRGHASELAEQAANDDLDLVVALGGDGTVNEVVNGLMRGAPGHDRPALAVVPGGSANVFARVLGMPTDPIEATAAFLEALRAGRRHEISLGTANDRYFAFCAGIGLDAEVVGLVEAARARGRRATPGLYARTALRHYFTGTDRHYPRLSMTLPGEDTIEHLFMAVVTNTAPWTYFRHRPVNPTPDASFDTALDVFAMRRLRTVSSLRTVRQMFSDPRGPHGKDVVRRHDLGWTTVHATGPTALQLDGDYVGEFGVVEFRDVPRALTVIA